PSRPAAVCPSGRPSSSGCSSWRLAIGVVGPVCNRPLLLAGCKPAPRPEALGSVTPAGGRPRPGPPAAGPAPPAGRGTPAATAARAPRPGPAATRVRPAAAATSGATNPPRRQRAAGGRPLPATPTPATPAPARGHTRPGCPPAGRSGTAAAAPRRPAHDDS